MLKTIDKYAGFVIQKVTKPNGAIIGYQTAPEKGVGDSALVKRHVTLSLARVHIGMPQAASVETAPKSAYPQNAKGYRADMQKDKSRK